MEGDDFTEDFFLVPAVAEEDGGYQPPTGDQEEEEPGIPPDLSEGDFGDEENYGPEIIEVLPEDDTEPEALPLLEVTWAVLDDEPALDYLTKEIGDSLDKMKEVLQIFPFQVFGGGVDRIFEARFEFPVGHGEKRYPEGFAETKRKAK